VAGYNVSGVVKLNNTPLAEASFTDTKLDLTAKGPEAGRQEVIAGFAVLRERKESCTRC